MASEAKSGGGNDSGPPLSESEIISSYRRMLKECQDIRRKVGELEQEATEHELVMSTLNELNDDRRAYRLVGGVLVERTVGGVLPNVSQNLEGIGQVLENLRASLTKVEAEAAKWKVKYGIKTQDEMARATAPMPQAGGAQQQSSGVLA